MTTLMPDRERFREDLPRLAAENFALANRNCQSCGHMHALWPYIRLARASTGVEGASSRLDPVLSELIAAGHRRVLIAGSQDTGLLALVARAAGTATIEITVLDRCASPLETCRRLAQAWSLPIETMHQDLMNLEVKDRFDLALVHGTLHYIPPDRRVDVLTRLRQALRPAGVLVLLFNTGSRVVGELSSDGRRSYATWVIEELQHLGVQLPEEREAFAARLRVHAENRERREGAFGRPEEVHQLLAKSGFDVRQWFEIDVKLANAVQGFVSKLSKRRFLTIAEVPLNCAKSL
jgi:SAM-dependent methyltransferase